MNKGKFLKYTLYFFGLLCLALFIITKSSFLMEKLTVSGTPYGNLYNNCRVDIFKIPMEPTRERPETFNRVPIDSCDLIVIGDSFVSSCPGHYYFGVELQQRLNRPVFQLEIKPDLFYQLNHSGITRTDHRRIFLFESGESGLIKNFTEIPDLQPRPDDVFDFTQPRGEVGGTPIMNLRKRWFIGTERNYSYFLKNNIIWDSAIEWYYSMLFHQFGHISPYTPIYSVDPPFLFESRSLGRQPSSFYYNHTDRVIDRLTDNIKIVADTLDALYNVQFVMLAIPDKYTLYHTLINDDEYDNYLPRVQESLQAKGIPFIDLYEPYTSTDEILYHPADNHWVAEGVAIALDVTVPALQTLLPARDNLADVSP